MSLIEAQNMKARLPQGETPESLREFTGQLARVVLLETLWYPDIITGLRTSALEYLTHWGMSPEQIELASVPGSFELPLAAQSALRRSDFVVALGCVVRGGTPHFDYVCQGVADGLMRVSLEAGKPVGFGVLTVDSVAQAQERTGKGLEAAQAALFMALLLKKARG